MLCEECGIREANVRFTTISGGKSYEKMLCAQCLAKHKQELLDGISLGDLMAGFLKEEQNGEAPAEGLRCPGCGMAYEEFKSKGRLGCAKCYKAFSAQLEPVLARMHGRVRHAGKLPQSLREKTSDQDRIHSLKEEMEKAVAVEDFERAASLRDQIKALQKEAE